MKLRTVFCCLIPVFPKRHKDKTKVADAWSHSSATKSLPASPPLAHPAVAPLAGPAGSVEEKMIDKSAPLTLADLIHSAPPPSPSNSSKTMMMMMPPPPPAGSTLQAPPSSTSSLSSATCLPPVDSLADWPGPLSAAPFAPLLPSLPLTTGAAKPTLVLDLDETLIHSSFSTYVPAADFTLALSLGGSVVETVYVQKRPYVDQFLASLAAHYELVIFTASLSSYANLVIDLLDPQGEWISHRLYRESCVYYRGSYIKDLSRLGRSLDATLILDNSPMSYAWHPHHAIPILSWYSDPHDVQLLELMPILIHAASSSSNAESTLMARYHATKNAKPPLLKPKQKDDFVLTLSTSSYSTLSLPRHHSLDSSVDLLEHEHEQEQQQQQQEQQQSCSPLLIPPLS